MHVSTVAREMLVLIEDIEEEFLMFEDQSKRNPVATCLGYIYIYYIQNLTVLIEK